jgi:hypothetical protein
MILTEPLQPLAQRSEEFVLVAVEAVIAPLNENESLGFVRHRE